MRFTRLGLILGALLVACPVQAADIIWFSSITDPAGPDAGFVDLLEGAGHTVTRYAEVAPLGADDITALNAADLVITGRSVNSSAFDNANGQVWNEQITTPMIATSAYIVRQSRMGWQANSSVPDSGPTPLVATFPNHYIFSGIDFAADGRTMAEDYNVMIDRGISTISGGLQGGTILATNPLITDGVAIAAWDAGTVVTDDGIGMQTLAGPRYFFAAGSREADGSGVDTAGVLDLTDAGQRLFLNTVDYALGIPEPSTAVLALLGVVGVALFYRKP